MQRTMARKLTGFGEFGKPSLSKNVIYFVCILFVYKRWDWADENLKQE